MNEKGNWIVFFFKEKITLKHLNIVRSSDPRTRYWDSYYCEIVMERSALKCLHLTLTFKTAKNLRPNLQKPPLSSKIHGYAPEMVRLFFTYKITLTEKEEIVSEKIISKD